MQSRAQPLEIIVLAAGQGTRMRSQMPKVLHELAGRSLLTHVLTTARSLAPDAIHVVVGHQAEQVRSTIGTGMGDSVTWVRQDELLGTGHAVQQALPAVGDDANVLILYGDVPLVSQATLERCVQAAEEEALGLVTAEFADPAELGRIVRNGSGAIIEIVEYKDASPQQRAIDEINSGIIALRSHALKKLLAQVKNNNTQREYYLTDIIALAVANNIGVQGLKAASASEVAGINDRQQLAELERIYQRRQASALMQAGVTLADPKRLDVRGDVVAGEDCFIDANVVLQGKVVLGRGVRIASGSVVTNSDLGNHVRVEPNTVIEGARVAPNCVLGPFARIRPGTDIGEGAKVGNFVEMKKTILGAGSKAGHLTYLGDATIGADCNIGAGTVTCNYDGVNKHETHIGDDVFVGTNSTLVAPIEIDDEAFIAAGSTVTSKVNKGDLAVGRARQRNIEGWTRPEARKPKTRK